MENEKPCILYVDDDEQNLSGFKFAFRKEYKVFTASSGNAALEILRQNGNDIQVIVSDQRMPEMTGVEFLKKVISEFPQLKAARMIMSGYSDIEATIRAINEAGICQFVMKPWEKEALVKSIDKGLEMYRLNSKI
jgi:response regulator RpfG family c-di-GMP phosphodiesterase